MARNFEMLKQVGKMCCIGLISATVIICSGCDMGTYEQRLNEQKTVDSAPNDASQ